MVAAKRRILVVDDSRTVQTLLRRTLSLGGYDVLIAGDGSVAIDIAAHTIPDLVVLDIQMPTMDGYAVCAKLKSMGPPWSQIPIIFLTVVESRALGLLGNEMGAYLRKPAPPQRVLAAVHRFLPVGCEG